MIKSKFDFNVDPMELSMNLCLYGIPKIKWYNKIFDTKWKKYMRMLSIAVSDKSFFVYDYRISDYKPEAVLFY